jgi:hypothetical protein
LNVGESEVFRWNRTPRQTSQKSKLSSVGHGVREWALQQNLRSHVRELRPELDVPRGIGERFVEVGDSGLEVEKFGCSVTPA